MESYVARRLVLALAIVVASVSGIVFGVHYMFARAALLTDAARRGDVSAVRELVDSGMSIERRELWLETRNWGLQVRWTHALHEAVKSNSDGTIAFLLASC